MNKKERSILFLLNDTKIVIVRPRVTELQAVKVGLFGAKKNLTILWCLFAPAAQGRHCF